MALGTASYPNPAGLYHITLFHFSRPDDPRPVSTSADHADDIKAQPISQRPGPMYSEVCSERRLLSQYVSTASPMSALKVGTSFPCTRIANSMSPPDLIAYLIQHVLTTPSSLPWTRCTVLCLLRLGPCSSCTPMTAMSWNGCACTCAPVLQVHSCCCNSGCLACCIPKSLVVVNNPAACVLLRRRAREAGQHHPHHVAAHPDARAAASLCH